MGNFNFTPGARSKVFTFTGPQGTLKAAIEVCGDGLYLFVEPFENPVAKVDLFYRIEPVAGPVGANYAQIVAYDTTQDEAVAFVPFLDDGTRVFFENGVQWLGRAGRDAPALYGYPPDEAEG